MPIYILQIYMYYIMVYIYIVLGSGGFIGVIIK